jgi:hypothetical protein
MPGLDEHVESEPGRFPTLDALTREPADAHGVDIGSLEPGEILTVQTRNTRYEIEVVDPANCLALVRGGTVFPERTEVVIKGSTAGGSAIKRGWICAGLFLEMTAGVRRITTSRVQSVIVKSFHDSLPLTA